MIGQILTALRENGLDENTLILYTSDHGEQVGEHGLWWKQTFYEHSVKVPAILSWRGALPEGTRCDRVISSLGFECNDARCARCTGFTTFPWTEHLAASPQRRRTMGRHCLL